MKRHDFWVGIWEFEHLDRNGNVLDSWQHQNALADEGEQNLLDAYFRAQNAPSIFYIRLFNDTPVETDSISSLTGEPSTNGYTAQALNRNTSGFPTLELNSGDYRVISSQVTFSATGGSWGAVTYATLTTSSDSSGKLIAYVALSTPRTLADGETLKVRFYIKLQ